MVTKGHYSSLMVCAGICAIQHIHKWTRCEQQVQKHCWKYGVTLDNEDIQPDHAEVQKNLQKQSLWLQETMQQHGKWISV